MLQTKKGNQWHFCMRGHIGINANSGLVQTVMGTVANANDVTQAVGLLHDKESTRGVMRATTAWTSPGSRRAANEMAHGHTPRRGVRTFQVICSALRAMDGFD